jgi:putative transposase
MPNYRRARVAGGTFFFTVVTDRRRKLFADPAARTLLGSIFRRCQLRWPFEMSAIVLLPDHLHTIWSLPPGDADYSKRWGWIKKTFTSHWLRRGHTETRITRGRERERRRGVWQPRFWEHTIETDEDYDRHFDYTHYNAVKHGYVTCPSAWPHSSFHRWVRTGVYPPDWACVNRHPQPMTFSDIQATVGE